MRWVLDPEGDYYTGAWWDCIEPDTQKRVGTYRMTEHGWWDVRTWYFHYDVRTNKGNEMLLPLSEYTEEEVRRIVENAWAIGKGDRHEARTLTSIE